MAHQHAGKTVEELLRTKQGRIRRAPLDPGSPDWDEILDLAWEDIEERADRNEPGFRTIKKLLNQKRFNK
jgi:hypothetical protein